MLSNKSGSSVLTTPIIIALGIMIVTVLLHLVVEVIMPYLWYEKLSSTSIKYVYLMEEFGYLTNKEANLLKDDLENQGFKMKNINIEYTNNKVDYGEPIYLKIFYKYELKIPLASSKLIDMQVERNSVCKR